MLKLSLITLPALFGLVQLMALDCRYDSSLHATYTCNALIQFYDGDERNVSRVSQSHLVGRTNKDVLAMQINTQNIRFMPRGVEKFFPNLQTLMIYLTRISEISSEDLKFPELKRLSVYNCQIDSLDKEIFKHTPKLEAINFNQVGLHHVSSNFLGDLKHLKEARFLGNPCINLEVNQNHHFPTLYNALNESCPPLESKNATTELPITMKTTATAQRPYNESSSGLPDYNSLALEVKLQQLVDKVVAARTCQIIEKCPSNKNGVSTDEKFEILVHNIVAEYTRSFTSTILKLRADMEYLWMEMRVLKTPYSQVPYK